jgi:hypothetical protein
MARGGLKRVAELLMALGVLVPLSRLAIAFSMG